MAPKAQPSPEDQAQIDRFWDDNTDDDLIRFQKKGDKFAGVLVAFGKTKLSNGDMVPQLTFEEDGTGLTRLMTLAGGSLKREFTTKRPTIGDHCLVHLFQIDDPIAQGLSGARHYSLTVNG